jgi:hypothetical protein
MYLLAWRNPGCFTARRSGGTMEQRSSLYRLLEWKDKVW